MTLGGIKPGDIVRIARNGEPEFYATVSGLSETEHVRKGELLTCRLNGGEARIVTARMVIGHWRKSKSN